MRQEYPCEYERQDIGVVCVWEEWHPRISEVFGDWVMRTGHGFGDCTGTGSQQCDTGIQAPSWSLDSYSASIEIHDHQQEVDYHQQKNRNFCEYERSHHTSPKNTWWMLRPFLTETGFWNMRESYGFGDCVGQGSVTCL